MLGKTGFIMRVMIVVATVVSTASWQTVEIIVKVATVKMAIMIVAMMDGLQ